MASPTNTYTVGLHLGGHRYRTYEEAQAYLDKHVLDHELTGTSCLCDVTSGASMFFEHCQTMTFSGDSQSR